MLSNPFGPGTKGSGNKGWLVQSTSLNHNGPEKGDFQFWYFDDQRWHKYFAIDDKTGNVIIGDYYKAPSNYKLAVKGKIIAEELKVQLFGNWPDYVFQPSYHLLPLSVVEQHISDHGHLPNIPSASEIETQGGIEVGEMQRLMMEKIEELTLYVIDLQKEQQTQAEKIKALETALNNAPSRQ